MSNCGELEPDGENRLDCFWRFFSVSLVEIDEKKWPQCTNLATFTNNINRKGQLTSNLIGGSYVSFVNRLGAELDRLLQVWALLRKSTQDTNFDTLCNNGICTASPENVMAAQSTLYLASIDASAQDVMVLYTLFQTMADFLKQQYPLEGLQQYEQPFDVNQRFALFENANDTFLSTTDIQKNPIDAWQKQQAQVQQRVNVIRVAQQALNAELYSKCIFTITLYEFGCALQQQLYPKRNELSSKQSCSYNLPTKDWTRLALEPKSLYLASKANSQDELQILSQSAKMLQTLLDTWNATEQKLDLLKDFRPSPTRDSLNNLLGSSEDALASIRRMEFEQKENLLQRLSKQIQESFVAKSPASSPNAQGPASSPNAQSPESSPNSQNPASPSKSLSQQFQSFLQKPAWLTKISKKFTKKGSPTDLADKLNKLQTEKNKRSEKEVVELTNQLVDYAPLVKTPEEAKVYQQLLTYVSSLSEESKAVNPAQKALDEYAQRLQVQIDAITSWPTIDTDTLSKVVRELQDYMNAEMGTSYTLTLTDVDPLFEVLKSLPDGYNRQKLQQPNKKGTQGQVRLYTYSKEDLINGASALSKEGSIWTIPFSIQVLSRPVSGASPQKTLIGGEVKTYKFKQAIQVADLKQLEILLGQTVVE